MKGTLYSVTILMSSQSSPSVICLQFGLSENDLVPLTPTSFPICADRRVFMRPGSRAPSDRRVLRERNGS